MNIQQVFNTLWESYSDLNPQAKSIKSFFEAQGNEVINDHVAFRTFAHPKVSIAILAKPFLALGYVKKGDYVFKEKKLYAEHFEHPNSSMPKIFISELKYQELSDFAQNAIEKMIEKVTEHDLKQELFCNVGRPWTISHQDYQKLYQESEYAAWMSAWGFRVNHFTVLINSLKTFDLVAEVNQALKDNGFKLNTSGGEIKGSPEVFLEQSSTLADAAQVAFSDGTFTVPACYYEFAKRYRLPAGDYYSGFVTTSADKIFESTNTAQK